MRLAPAFKQNTRRSGTKMATTQSHYLTIYDGQTEECIEAIKIPDFNLAAFKIQFDVLEQDDPNMLDRYCVSPLDTNFIAEYLNDLAEFDFQRFAYFIEALKP